MAQEEDDDLLNLFEQKKWPTLLGGEEFVSWVKQTFFQKKKNRQIPESLQLAPSRAQIIQEVCRIYAVEEQDLFIVRRGRSNEPRDVAIYLCRMLRNDTLKELGNTFGMTGYGPAGSVVNRVLKKLSQDTNLEHRVDYLKNCFLKNKTSIYHNET